MSISLRVLVAICLLWAVSGAKALTPAEQKMLDRATPYFGMLRTAVDTAWPDPPTVSMFASQVEKESLWNPRAELCVPKPSCSRERGIGFGQMTITPRFNVFREVGLLHPALRNWTPDKYYDPQLQLIAVVAKDLSHFKQFLPLMENEVESVACMLSSYNGGFGGFSTDRKLCSNTKGCDPRLWYGHVEHVSMKAKVAQAGYGQSFFQINRGYVRGVWFDRRVKYVTALDAEPLPPQAIPSSPDRVVDAGPGVRATSPLAAVLPNAGKLENPIPIPDARESRPSAPASTSPPKAHTPDSPIDRGG